MGASLWTGLPLAVFLALPVAARADDGPHHRTHPEFARRMAALRTIGVVVPTLKVFELNAGSRQVYQPEWTASATESVAAALEEALRIRGLSSRRIAPAGAGPDELREVTLLYEAVGNAIMQATYVFRFPAKMERFEYAVGDLKDLLATQGVDGLVFTYGQANISSGGRKALQVLSGLGSGIDRLFLGLVDGEGAVLWFDWKASSAYDLRDRDSSYAFVRSLTDGIPAVQP